MLAFHDPEEALHAPRFFLMRGALCANYEVPARAAALREGLAGLGITAVAVRPAEEAALAVVHARDYLAYLREAHTGWAALHGAGPEVVANMHPSPEMLAQGASFPAHPVAAAGRFMADTACPIGPGTWRAVLGAAGAALAAAESAAQGRCAYALCRPPGHHAYAARAGGHCYVNNSALAAERLRALGAARVAVLDIDSHHGNGTQGIFWERPDVLTVSVHGDPRGYYPWFVGHAGERGGGLGAGCNRNLPVTLGGGDGEWLDALGEAVAEIARFQPDAMVLALGFDASEHEPLAALKVTREGFARAAAMIAALRLPTAICQEGGYAVAHLGDLLGAFLGAWGDA
jgi:acetoin utilization deacetylase AcuC-like enzyme